MTSKVPKSSQKHFIPSKAEFEKLNFPISLNSLKTIVDDIGVGKLTIVPLYLKKLSKVVKN